METFFSEQVTKFITNDMKLCINDLTRKILSDVPQSYQFFNDLFEYIMIMEIPYEYEDTLISFNNDENRKFIDDSLYDFLESNNLNEESDEHFIFDNIRHAYINFKKGGILNMYQYREAEVWYPKVIIDSFLGNEDDIKELGQNITVYRGTSIDEFTSKVFGQSWTLNKKIAEDFAFTHYNSQPDYQNTTRVILETTIDKNIIFFYAKSGRENEVIVDSKKLNAVKIIDSKVLN